MPALTTSPAKARADKASAWLTVAEVADLLGCEPARLQRVLEREETRLECLPGAKREQGQWLIPSRDVRRLLGPREERLYSVADFAELIGFSVSYVHELIARGIIAHRRILGLIRLPASSYYALPAHKPEPKPEQARPAFFFSRREAQQPK